MASHLLYESSTLLRTPLSALLAVADAGSFSEAAARLGLAQSTLSYAVRQAEEALGVIIFERGRHGARLTPAGEAIMVHARHAALALQAMQLTVHGQLSGTLRIASCRSILRHVITPALRAFHARYPQVEVVVIDTRGEHAEIAHLVDSGQVHLGLGRLPMPTGLITAPVVANEYLIVTLLPHLRSVPGMTCMPPVTLSAKKTVLRMWPHILPSTPSPLKPRFVSAIPAWS